MSDSESDEPALSSETLATLTEFLNEQQLKEQSRSISDQEHISDVFKENWQLSQFWYDENTTDLLVNGAINSTKENEKIALLCCPTLYNKLKSNCNGREVVLLEYDKRFSIFGSNFIQYDYKSPLVLPEELSGQIDLVIADPPFLSEECMTKVATTIQFLTNKKIVFCTGAVMADIVQNLLDLKKCNFTPHHKNNLANEFCCYSNFDFDKAIKTEQCNNSM